MAVVFRQFFGRSTSKEEKDTQPSTSFGNECFFGFPENVEKCIYYIIYIYILYLITHYHKGLDKKKENISSSLPEKNDVNKENTLFKLCWQTLSIFRSPNGQGVFP